MNTPLGRLVIGTVPGLVATVIAVTVVWQLTEHESISRDDFNTLDKRLISLEQRLHPSTSKRFTSTDATALEARLVKCHQSRDYHGCLEDERLAYELRRVEP